jgi:hypothetical protein
VPVPPVAALTAGAAPGAWAFGGEVPSPSELNELWLNTDLLRQRDLMQGAAHEELAALHAGAAEPAPARAQVTFTRLDAQGRLPVPLCPVLDERLAGERDGAFLVVFLPAADRTPRPSYETPRLQVDARRRLLLGPPLRALLGLADNGTVITRFDRAQGVLELMAAARIEPQLDELFDAHRRDAAPQTVPATEMPASPASPSHRGGLTALPGGRLRNATGPAPFAAPVSRTGSSPN